MYIKHLLWSIFNSRDMLLICEDLMEIFSKTFLFYLFNPWIRIVLYTGMKHCFFQYYSTLIKKYGTVCIWKCVFTFVLVASLPEVTLWLTVLFMSSSCLAASSSEDSLRRMSSLLAILSSSSSFSSLSAISATTKNNGNIFWTKW